MRLGLQVNSLVLGQAAYSVESSPAFQATKWLFVRMCRSKMPSKVGGVAKALTAYFAPHTTAREVCFLVLVEICPDCECLVAEFARASFLVLFGPMIPHFVLARQVFSADTARILLGDSEAPFLMTFQLVWIRKRGSAVQAHMSTIEPGQNLAQSAVLRKGS